MKTLLFTNPVFLPGTNVTVRRGVQWSTQTHATVCNRIVSLTPIVIRFCDIQKHDIEREHDPKCRTVSGLHRELCKIYPRFHKAEIVTLIRFQFIQ